MLLDLLLRPRAQFHLHQRAASLLAGVVLHVSDRLQLHMFRSRGPTSRRMCCLAGPAAAGSPAIAGRAVRLNRPSGSSGIPAPHGVTMAIPVRALAMGDDALRHEKVEFVPDARHSDIKKAPLLLGVRACGEIRGGSIRRRRSAQRPTAILDPWQNGWSREPDNPHPEAEASTGDPD